MTKYCCSEFRSAMVTGHITLHNFDRWIDEIEPFYSVDCEEHEVLNDISFCPFCGKDLNIQEMIKSCSHRFVYPDTGNGYYYRYCEECTFKEYLNNSNKDSWGLTT